MFKSILSKFCGKEIEHKFEEKAEPQIMNKNNKPLNEIEQLVFDAFCKFYRKKENILNSLQNYYMRFTRPTYRIVGNFKFNFSDTITVGIYDKTEPELYEKILFIENINNKIKIEYRSGIWDNTFIKTMENDFENRIREIKQSQLEKQERIRKMFSDDCNSPPCPPERPKSRDLSENFIPPFTEK